MTRICPACAAQNALDARFCNQCGCTLPIAQAASPGSFSARHPILIAGLLMILVVVFLGTDWWLWRHRSRALDGAPVAAEPEPAAQPVRIATPLRPTVQALCADRSNFITRNYCMDRQCRKPENGRDPDCVKILADEKERNNRFSPG